MRIVSCSTSSTHNGFVGRLKRRVGIIAVTFLATLASCGNVFNQHAQMMDAMRGVMTDTAARLGQSGTGQIAAGGQVINPGIRVKGGVEYYAEAAYVGVSGQVQASMMGTLDRPIPPEVQARADAIWQSTTLATDQKLRLITQLLQTWMQSKNANASPTTEPSNAK